MNPYLSRIKRKIIFKIEAKKIISSNKNIINCFYDFEKSPQTYGDLIDVLFLLRMISSLGKKVNLTFINKNYRKDWILEKKDIFIKNFIDICPYLLPKGTSFKFINNDRDEDLYININQYNLFANYFFKSKNLSYQKVIYNKSQDLCYELYHSTKNKEFLITSGISKNLTFEYHKPKSYIALPLRYNTDNIQTRNLNQDSKLIVDLLLENSNLNIMVISDLKGCQFYKNILKKYEKTKRIFYCKDYNNGFIDDVETILNSAFYCQFRGGGMLTIARNSNIPYLIANEPSPFELNLKYTKNLPWSSENQYYVTTNRYSDFINKFDQITPMLKKLNIFC